MQDLEHGPEIPLSPVAPAKANDLPASEIPHATAGHPAPPCPGAEAPDPDLLKEFAPAPPVNLKAPLVEILKNPAAHQALETALAAGKFRSPALQQSLRTGLDGGPMEVTSQQEWVIRIELRKALVPCEIEAVMADLKEKMGPQLDRRVTEAILSSPLIRGLSTPRWGKDLQSSKPSLGDAARFANQAAIHLWAFQPEFVESLFMKAFNQPSKKDLYQMVQKDKVRLYPVQNPVITPDGPEALSAASRLLSRRQVLLDTVGSLGGDIRGLSAPDALNTLQAVSDRAQSTSLSQRQVGMLLLQQLTGRPEGSSFPEEAIRKAQKCLIHHEDLARASRNLQRILECGSLALEFAGQGTEFPATPGEVLDQIKVNRVRIQEEVASGFQSARQCIQSIGEGFAQPLSAPGRFAQTQIVAAQMVLGGLREKLEALCALEHQVQVPVPRAFTMVEDTARATRSHPERGPMELLRLLGDKVDPGSFQEQDLLLAKRCLEGEESMADGYERMTIAFNCSFVDVVIPAQKALANAWNVDGYLQAVETRASSLAQDED